MIVSLETPKELVIRYGEKKESKPHFLKAITVKTLSIDKEEV